MMNVVEAQRIFEEACTLNPGDWTKHSMNVAQLAKAIAIGAKLDGEKAYVLGLLHDIGRRNGAMRARHAIEGYDYMKDKCEEVARICMTHTFQYQDVNGIYDTWDCTEKERAWVQNYLSEVTYDDYDKLIQFCDAVSTAKGYCTVEEKMVSSAMKFGFNETTLLKWQAIVALKKYWDEKLGDDTYHYFKRERGLSCIFPAADLIKTADFYTNKLKFTAAKYLGSSTPHVCLYKGDIEIILTQAQNNKVTPNRVLYGYGYDAYIYTNNLIALQNEFEKAGVKIVQRLGQTDYQNHEIVIEDLDGRWLAFGFKEK